MTTSDIDPTTGRLGRPGGTARAVELVEDLERTLLDFVRRNRVTHEEYRAATDLIIDEVQAGEASLLFDVFLEAEATDVGNVGRAGSPEAIEGPFYLSGAPELDPPHRMPQRPDEPGTPLVFSGTVTGPGGEPLSDVEIDMWQADAAGCYSQIHPGLPEWNLRGRFRTRPDGTFEVTTILPPPYEIPKNGPTGTVLDMLGRHFFRPAHLHLKLRHPSCAGMTSQLYFEGGDYLDSDVAGAVRDGLVLALGRCDDPEQARARGLAAESFLTAHYDFRMWERTDR